VGGPGAVSLGSSPATVQFGLLAAVQLLAATAFLALGVAGVWPRLRGPASTLLGLAAVVLAVPEVITGFRFGESSGTLLTGVRAAGALLLAGALSRGALRPEGSTKHPVSNGARDVGAAGPVAGAAVIAPLGAMAPVAWLAVAAFVVAAITAWSRPLRLRLPLMAGLLLSAAAELLAPAARTSSSAAVQLLLIRGLGALCLLAVLVVLARTSVLGRVATVIFTAVLLTATGAVAVAGTVTTSTLEREQSDTARRLHRQAQTEIEGQVQRTASTAAQLAGCPGGPEACPGLVSPTTVVAELHGGRAERILGPDDPAVLAVLPRVPIVVAAARAPGAVAQRASSQLIVIAGRPNRLMIVGLSGAGRADRPTAVVRRLDLPALIAARNADLSVVVLPGAQGVATTFSPALQSRLSGLIAAQTAAVSRSSATDPAVLPGLRARGRAAAAPVAPVVSASGSPQPIAVLAAASRDDVLVRTQRRVLAGLFLALAATAVLVGLLGVALGAGVVRPIRRITDAARRVRAGELGASAGPGGPDELGELARAFDAMTTSLTGAQEELRQTAEREATLRARLSTVVDSLGDGLMVVNDEQVVTSSNPAARQLLRFDPVGCLFGEVLPAGDEVVLDRGKDTVSLSVRRTPLADGGGTVVLLRDRSRELQAERMKTQFLANVSHELRTPLTPVRGYAELLRRRRDAGPDEVAEHAGAIAAAADRLGRVVDLLVDVAALDAGRVTPTIAPMQLAPFLAERLTVWRTRRPQRADDLVTVTEARLPAVLADPRWLAKAVDELLDNALKYAPAGSEVRLEATRMAGFVRVGVRDSGPGLDGTTRAALYDDFTQADGSVTRAQDGLGLGLPFVRRVAALFELELVVESLPGSGSFFGLDVPLAPRPVPQRGVGRRAKSPSADSSSSGPRGMGTTSA
jgi:signal transduction histidine kinase/HAMP domain-containing protein